MHDGTTFNRKHLLHTIRKYGNQPYRIGLLHGGPGASGEMKPVAERLSADFGILELLQTEKSVKGQIEELHQQLTSIADLPVILIGHSWGAWLGFLFTNTYPKLISKLILIGAGSFVNKYNSDLITVRLDRLNHADKNEAQGLIQKINSGDTDIEVLKRFGELMIIADSYDYQPIENETIDLDMDIFLSVWQEASKLRDSNDLIKFSDKITCPVVAIHGDYDSHPIEGVEKPLSERLPDFKMIRLEKCGHTPWKERFARTEFYEKLRKELKFETKRSKSVWMPEMS